MATTADGGAAVSESPRLTAMAATTARRRSVDRGMPSARRSARRTSASRRTSATVSRSLCLAGSAICRSTSACSAPSNCPRACAVSMAAEGSSRSGSADSADCLGIMVCLGGSFHEAKIVCAGCRPAGVRRSRTSGCVRRAVSPRWASTRMCPSCRPVISAISL